MSKIPLYTLNIGEFAFSRHSFDQQYTPKKDTHQDDYYIFIVMESGNAKILLDFEEYEIGENEIFCIPPRQVHSPANQYKNIDCSFLAVDSLLVRNEHKEIFDSLYVKRRKVKVNESIAAELKYFFSAIHSRLHKEKQTTERLILHDLISSYVGIIAQAHREEMMISINNQATRIVSRFKTLLSEEYELLKRPSHYAERLNISSAYLNECVKKITGMTVGEWIHNEIALQAKRLLVYTNFSVKEIAQQLGYEDCAYFTRLFTKVAKISPTAFRKEYFKYHD